MVAFSLFAGIAFFVDIARWVLDHLLWNHIRNKTLEKTTTNPAYYTPGKFSKTCHNFILIKFSPNYVFLCLLGSCDITLLVNWHSGNYAFGLVHDPYVALDGTPVGNYFFFIS